MEIQRTENIQNDLEKVGEFKPPNFKTYYKAIVIKSV